MSAITKAARSLFPLFVALYFAAWIVALAGLAALQHQCNDTDAVGFTRFFNVFFMPPGKNCHRFFSLPWTILFLGMLPLIMEALALMKKNSAGQRRIGGGAPLFAAVAPLFVFMAHLFYQMSKLGGTTGKLDRRLKTTLSGFAIMAAFSFLAVLLSALTQDEAQNNGPDMRSFTTTQTTKPAETVPVVSSTPTTTTTTGARPIVATVV